MAIHAITLLTLSLLCYATALHLEFYPGTQPYHQTGSRYDNTAWLVSVQDPPERYLTYGPFTEQWNTTVPSRVDFYLGVDNNVGDPSDLLTVDVNDPGTDRVLTSRNISRLDFGYASVQPQVFSLYFSSTPGHSLEFRVYYRCCSKIVHYKTVVDELDGGALAAIFAGQGGLELVSSSTFPTPHADPSSSSMWNVGTYVKPLDGKWYIFYREGFYAPTPEFCNGIVPLTRIAVRNSTDFGKSWSEPAVIASPGNLSADNCAVLDGAPFFDNETDSWHYLAQCIGTNKRWDLCHYSRSGRDPMSSPFLPNPANPVVQGGQLWSKICSGREKHCTSTMYDEGTPEIVEKINGWFYVTFHGWDGPNNKAARGIARTRDFVNYDVAGYDLPDDAIFSSLDCNGWNITWSPQSLCVGGGEGSMAKSGDYFYHLIEAPDITLNCDTTLGEQNWVLGLLRSPRLSARSGEWEQIRFNPAFKPAKKYGCGIQYHRIFRDENDFFFSMFVIDFEVGKLTMKVWKVVSGQTYFPVLVSYP
ncbi:unnamed protein product [Didymodactylos carnosus]|uniref:Uncharacterized protein n=1 Tax=Didymodactylos carnosus TaxID=1234261 RepID=A0A814VDL7_9BILA|nr:unnamed protein product [Didymodactylos carnosus]CAF3950980.1 unnamed protein product [Didymodactylos carnosus]